MTFSPKRLAHIAIYISWHSLMELDKQWKKKEEEGILVWHITDKPIKFETISCFPPEKQIRAYFSRFYQTYVEIRNSSIQICK